MILRPYQSEAVDAAWSYLCSRRDDPVLVAPTGSGKSLLIAALCRDAVTKWDGRVVVLAHRKELLEQNAEKIKALLPDLDIGIYSAGLRRRDTDHRVLVAGIQSIYDKASQIGLRHLVIIDEAHLVPSDGEGMYRTFLDDLKKYVPFARKVGLTATPYRLDCGPLCGPDRLFARVAHSVPIRPLMEAGFLCPITTESSRTEYDTAKLPVRGGEFVPAAVSTVFGDSQKIAAACEEIVARTLGRTSILVFCASVNHAESVANELSRLTGEPVGCVTGETDPMIRASTLGAFRNGNLRIVCNVDVLTTGFDAPNIDAIAVLRATLSPGLFAQICGRGFRPHPSKQNCMILDFGENFRRHGALDDPAYGVASSGSAPDSPGEVPIKVCPGCGREVHAAAKECACGLRFPPRELKHGESPDDMPALVEPTVRRVLSWSAARHDKKGSPTPTMRVEYLTKRAGSTGNLSETIREWVCIEHSGFAREKACKWWVTHSRSPVPKTVAEALALFDREALAMPDTITTVPEGPFQTITARVMPELPESWAELPKVDEWAVEPSESPSHEEIVEEIGDADESRESCPNCGSEDTVIGPGKPPHYASVRCAACDRFIKWMAKPAWSSAWSQEANIPF